MNNNTSTQVHKILQEIYLIDPSLQSKEDKLIMIIEEIISSAPDTKFDPAFVNRLKSQLLVEADKLKNSPVKNTWKFSWDKLVYVGSGALAVILLFAVMLPNNFLGFNQITNIVKKPNQGSNNIIALGDRAFGELNVSLNNVPGEQSADGVLGMGGSSTVNFSAGIREKDVSDAPMLDQEVAVNETMAVNDIMIMPYPQEMVRYNYVYNGQVLDNFDLSTISNLVYRRRLNDTLATQAGSLLTNLSGLPINLNSFNQQQLVNFYFNEQTDFGYSVSVNLLDNSIYINENWEKWPNPYKECYDEACYLSQQITSNDLLPNDRLISIANNFANNHGVNLNNYGTPEVDNNWKIEYERFGAETPNYLPDQLGVIYPTLINNQKVFDPWGNKDGLRINISLRHQRALGLYNLYFSDYESAAYDLIDDWDKFKTVLSRGGLQPDYYYGEISSEVDVELGDPQVALIKTWLPGENDYRSSEIYLPCLVFPVINQPNEYFYRRQVVVPLIKEVLDRTYNDYNNNFEVMPYPRILPAAGEGETSSGSAGEIEERADLPVLDAPVLIVE